MKAMARQRSHSIEFKRQVAQEFIAGESLYALSKRHDISRQLIRVWVEKYENDRSDTRHSGWFMAGNACARPHKIARPLVCARICEFNMDRWTASMSR